MRAVVLEQFGGPEVMQWREAPTPEPGQGQIRIRVAAAGVNRADTAARAGVYPARPRTGVTYFYPFPQLPASPGIEAAGIVDAVGADVTDFAVGDAVCGVTVSAAYAEYALITDWIALRIPLGLTFAEAAAIPAVFLTSWIALIEMGRAHRGETVLIHAVGSAVGAAATQLGKFLGLTVLGTSRTPSKLDAARAIGMDDGVNTRDADFVPWALDKTEGRGVDIVIDNVGGDTFSRSLHAIGQNGRIVVLSSTAGARPEIDLSRMVGAQAQVLGMSMAAMLTPDRMARFARDVMPGFAGSRLRAIVDQRFPMDEAPAAHARIAENRNFGKIVLVDPTMPERPA